MKLASEFIQLPLCFDVGRLAREADNFDEEAWDPHPLGYKGNSSLVLVSSKGERNNDYAGHMKPTEALEKCPYIKQVLSELNTVIGRTRLMRLEPGSVVPTHTDTNYTWKNRIRIHIPIVTDPGVVFSCGNIDVHMRAGESWVFDNWRRHTVNNNSDVRRVHLVTDTTGTADFWAMVARGRDPGTSAELSADETHLLKFERQKSPDIKFEKYNSMLILPPGEIENLSRDFVAELNHLRREDPDLFEGIVQALSNFQFDWRSVWSLHADTPEAIPHYESLIRDLRKQLSGDLQQVLLRSNEAPAIEVLDSWLGSTIDKRMLGTRGSVSSKAGIVEQADTSLFDCPVFIVAAPRSGSTMLFEILQQNIQLWTIGDESHVEIESIRQLHPASHQYESNALAGDDATPQVVDRLVTSFTRKMQNSQGTLLSMMPPETRPLGLRFLEKTPKNALRIPFLKEIFPSALFIFLHRDPRQNVGAIIDAWKSGRFVTYPDLPGWPGLPWSLLLPAGWREFKNRPLVDIAAHQWQYTNRTILKELENIPETHWCAVSYDSLIINRGTEVRRLCEFADIPFGPRMMALCEQPFPLSKYTLSKPDPEKWRRYEAEIERVMPGMEATAARLNSL